jgi:AcrR family transcriptional regulator
MSDALRAKTEELRRRHVLEAATRVFAERGFHAATIRDVARQAGVSDGTIYNVFENKAALLHGVLAALAEPPEDRTPGSGGPPSFLEGLFARRWASFTPETLARLRVVLAEALTQPEVRAEVLARVLMPPIVLLEPVLAGQAAEGASAPLEPAMTARVLAAVMLGLVMLRLLGEPEVEARADEIPAFRATLIADGMRPRSEAAADP